LTIRGGRRLVAELYTGPWVVEPGGVRSRNHVTNAVPAAPYIYRYGGSDSKAGRS